jgi:hypothetical protein
MNSVTLSVYLESQVHDEIRDALRTKLGFLGTFLNVTRIKEYDEMTDAIVGELLERINRLKVSKPMILKTIHKVGTLEDFLFRPNNELVLRHYHTDRSMPNYSSTTSIYKAWSPTNLRHAPSKYATSLKGYKSHLLWLEVWRPAGHAAESNLFCHARSG